MYNGETRAFKGGKEEVVKEEKRGLVCTESN
jgi:hypothetical protein